MVNIVKQDECDDRIKVIKHMVCKLLKDLMRNIRQMDCMMVIMKRLDVVQQPKETNRSKVDLPSSSSNKNSGH